MSVLSRVCMCLGALLVLGSVGANRSPAQFGQVFWICLGITNCATHNSTSGYCRFSNAYDYQSCITTSTSATCDPDGSWWTARCWGLNMAGGNCYVDYSQCPRP